VNWYFIASRLPTTRSSLLLLFLNFLSLFPPDPFFSLVLLRFLFHACLSIYPSRSILLSPLKIYSSLSSRVRRRAYLVTLDDRSFLPFELRPFSWFQYLLRHINRVAEHNRVLSKREAMFVAVLPRSLPA
jgi:hypothetical protein